MSASGVNDVHYKKFTMGRTGPVRIEDQKILEYQTEARIGFKVERNND